MNLMSLVFLSFVIGEFYYHKQTVPLNNKYKKRNRKMKKALDKNIPGSRRKRLK